MGLRERGQEGHSGDWATLVMGRAGDMFWRWEEPWGRSSKMGRALGTYFWRQGEPLGWVLEMRRVLGMGFGDGESPGDIFLEMGRPLEVFSGANLTGCAPCEVAWGGHI